MPTLWQLRRNHLQNYRIADVKVEKDRAVSELKFEDLGGGPGPDKLDFAKDDQGWLVDLRPDEDFLPGISSTGIKPKVAEKQKAQFDSPAKAFTALESGRQNYFSQDVWDSMTERMRNDFLFTGRKQLVGEHGDKSTRPTRHARCPQDCTIATRCAHAAMEVCDGLRSLGICQSNGNRERLRLRRREVGRGKRRAHAMGGR
jgi:hypothetical protein